MQLIGTRHKDLRSAPLLCTKLQKDLGEYGRDFGLEVRVLPLQTIGFQVKIDILAYRVPDFLALVIGLG